jgi:hypothetical protein
MGGIDGADARCAQMAKASKLDRVSGANFVAWSSTASSAAATRLVHGTSRYVLVGGGTVANSFLDLVDGTLAAPIDRDENGGPLSSDTTVWTGTAFSGYSGPPDCLGWTTVPSQFGTFGDTLETGAKWTSSASAACSEQKHIYCVEK